MDEIILKWITPLIGILTIIVCVVLLLLPKVHEDAVLAEEQYQELLSVTEAEDTEALEALAQEPVIVQMPEEIVETDEQIGAQLKIELPEGIGEKDIRIENDYITQTLYIYLPVTIKDYFSQYRVHGTCEHIAALSYYSRKEDGVIAIAMDRVYETKESFEDGGLFIDFFSPHDIYDKVIVVDAGHGGRASGASKNKIDEKNINLAIVIKLKELFDACPMNIGVYYTRTDDSNPTLDQRVQLANKSDADLFISVHNNATARNSYSGRHGTEVLYSESDTSELSSKGFADICQRNVVGLLNSKDLGLVPGDRIYIIRTSEVPVALLEAGYMTNRSELKLLASEEYQALIAQGIYNAILEAFEEGY